MNQIDLLEEEIKKYTPKYEGLPIALSGGIDSGLLAALIKPKFAISVQLPEGHHNEIRYAKKVASHLGIKHVIVELDESKFDKYMYKAVKTIGRPIPHFNIFPLYAMYMKLAEMGETELVLGDGPDETMCGYARDLIIAYLYKIYDYEAFKPYTGLIDKILPYPSKAVAKLVGRDFLPDDQSHETALEKMIRVDIDLMRPDMDDMSNKIADHFGIVNVRPYQDNADLDKYMRDLPVQWKIADVEFGKYTLRRVAERYLPYDIAWRKVKVGGPVYPVNKLKGWDKMDGEFGKNEYLKYQQDILNETN